MSAQEIKELARTVIERRVAEVAMLGEHAHYNETQRLHDTLGAAIDELQAAHDAQAAEMERLRADLREAGRQFHALEDRANADAEHAAFYRWLRDDKRGRALSLSALEWSGDPVKADAVIRAAMKGRMEHKPHCRSKWPAEQCPCTELDRWLEEQSKSASAIKAGDRLWSEADIRRIVREEIEKGANGND